MYSPTECANERERLSGQSRLGGCARRQQRIPPCDALVRLSQLCLQRQPPLLRVGLALFTTSLLCVKTRFN